MAFQSIRVLLMVVMPVVLLEMAIVEISFNLMEAVQGVTMAELQQLPLQETAGRQPQLQDLSG